MKSLCTLLATGIVLLICFNGIAQQPASSKTLSDSATIAQAVASYNKGLHHEAISLCDIVIKRNPNYSWAFNVRAICWAGLGAIEKTKNDGYINDKVTQYYENSITDYTKAIKIDAAYKIAISNRALSYKALNRYSEAIRDYEAVIVLDPKNAEAWKNKANVYFDSGDYVNSISAYDNAILYDINYAWNYYYRAKANYFLKKYREAIPDITLFLTKESKYADGYNIRGLCLYYLGELDKASDDFTTAVGFDPSFQYAYYNRGNVYYDQKNYPVAIADYTLAIKADPNYLEAWNARGNAYEASKDYVKAESDYLQAISIKKDYKYAYYNIGMIYYNQDKHEKAQYWFTEALKIDPKYVSTYVQRGWSNFNLKEYDKAIQDFSTAIALDPNTVNAYNNRGIAYTIMGKYTEAIEDLRTTIRLDPNFSWGYVNILIPCVQNQDYELARQFYKMYQDKNLSGYMETDRWKFLKTYLLACMNELDNKDYQKAQQLLKDASNQYQSYINAHSEVQENTKVYIGFVFSKLGITYEALNSTIEAKNYFDKALLINQNIPESQQGLVRLENKTKTYTSSDKTLPTLRLLPPRDTIVFEGTNKTTIIGKATDAGGIAWVKIDGKKVDLVEEDGTFYTEVNANPSKKFIDFEIQDKAGNNLKKSFASVTTRGGRISAPEDGLQLNGAKFYGLFITAEKYVDPTLATLNHPKKDAEDLKNVLSRNYSFNANDITILSDKSREDILEAISTTVEKMGQNDNLIIFFAGHGAYKTGINQTDIEGYLLPVSAKKGRYSTYISASDLTTALKNCKAHHVLLLTDACYSGSLVRRSTTENSAIDLQYKYKSRQLMASGNLEPVPDESKFIYYLLTRLKENTDKVLTADDLFQRLKNATINNTSGRTLPICSAILDVGDEGGQFVFVKK